MLEVTLITSENGIEKAFKLSQNSRLSLHENAVIEIQVKTEVSSSFEKPTVSIGDVPLDLMVLEESDGDTIYTSKIHNEFYKNQLFLNFFGESEVSIELENSSLVMTFICDIAARKANAILAREMLDYLSLRVDDVVKLCFSRTKKGVSLSDRNVESSFTKLSLVSELVKQVTQDLNLFLRYKSTKLNPETNLKEQAVSIGPESIHYVLNNIDRLTKTTSEHANIRANHCYYYLPNLPSEQLVESTDTIENQQIHFFILSVKKFLRDFKCELNNTVSLDQNLFEDSDYLHFDDVLSNFRLKILKKKMREIDGLINNVNYLSNFFEKTIPAKFNYTSKPKFTYYIKKTPHYNRLFKLIYSWFKAPSPNLEGDQLLLGVKNLSKLYEYTSLLLLNDVIMQATSAILYEAKYINYSASGQVTNESRPDNDINNDYRYIKDNLTIRLCYEPLIYSHSYNKTPNTLVNISGKKNTKHPEFPHAYCPDFVLEISKDYWVEPVYVILDAKFTNRRNIKERYLQDLMSKYFFGIHKIKDDLSLGSSPIQAVIAIFPHSTYGVQVNNIGREYCLSGRTPVLPNISGQLFTIRKTDSIERSLNNLINIVDSRYGS
ncbi:DUF2357 domain-containing protein [Vibrio aestuarianus]|uniref:nuclease domain-containing protein n=1 Tax=Vibrio aestuarianus TaxID=28171 RepID=UPI00237C55CE|nr:DUF2357 domain-containing protein [Vibrio aestuarianus]MDE1317752.1 DUF2357 domain-containing protein [Vibrio aestuarianus]